MNPEEARDQLLNASHSYIESQAWAEEHPDDGTAGWDVEYRDELVNKALVDYVRALTASEAWMDQVAAKADMGSRDNIERVMWALIETMEENIVLPPGR